MARRLLTDLELMVLLAVARVGDEAYGVRIAREIHHVAGRDVALAVVYVTLERLESRGLVSSTLGEPTASRGGRAKTFFRLTARGVREMQNTQRALSALWQGLRWIPEGAA